MPQKLHKMKFNDLPPTHKTGWCATADLVYKNMTKEKFFRLLCQHNPRVIRYGKNYEHSTWATDADRLAFFKKTGIELKY
jgi:hypothetical protein